MVNTTQNERDSGCGTYKDDTIETLLEPSHRILLLDTMLWTNTSPLLLPLRHTSPWSTHHNIEIHTKDTNGRIISCTKIDMFLNSKAKVSGFWKVLTTKFVFFDFESTFKDFLCFGSSNGNVNSDLFVTTDTECSDGVTSFGGDGGLTGELFEDFGSSCETITGFAYGNVCEWDKDIGQYTVRKSKDVKFRATHWARACRCGPPSWGYGE